MAEFGVAMVHMLEVWLALGGEQDAFVRMWDEDHRTPPDTWAQLMAVTRGAELSLLQDTNPPCGPEFERMILRRLAGIR